MPSIFILDDTVDILFTLDFWLSSNGYEVYTFTSSIDLMELMNSHTPDFILLDVRLSEIKDGRTVCLELRKHHCYTNKIYLFSACSVMNSDVHHFGADGFIKKPFDLHYMLHTIDRALS
jgi:DNA-binding response OmpR family regulator